ncbi:MAG TPA: HlyD family efflux transporter periplasmic adaptor subunit [Bacteroidales bacterium]|nr:HlyD family efflux transporter periplasmic adaptor subunit [Bacteroidales bacterium]HQB22669.1 HlyD family efflux transporter periplasmic adaptor subunit [Bacteroidales bacterium]
MIEFEEVNKIEIRSEEYQEVLGATPNWILRSGITIILLVIIILLIGSWFFKYPDVLNSRVVILTENPPVQLKAYASGKLTHIFYSENQDVQQDSVVAVIENTANLNDIFLISIMLDTLSDIRYFPENIDLKLGELQQTWSGLVRIISSYRNFIEIDYYEQKNKSLTSQINYYNKYYSGLLNQVKIMDKENSLALVQFERDKSLYNDNVIAKIDFEKSEQTYLQQKRNYESSKTSLINTQMQINQLYQQILDNNIQKTNELNTYEIQIEDALQGFKSQLAKWKQSYLIISPIDGRVSFNKVWFENQSVSAGDLIVTIIPKNEMRIIGKADIPSTGVGKVKPGQTVNIKLDNYPYMEFGMLKAKVKNISLVPITTEQGIFYTAEIELNDSILTTNYNKSIPFSQNMAGTAEIITDDLRLLERFLNPLRSIWKKSVE